MPKSKAKRKKAAGPAANAGISWGGKASAGTRRLNVLIGAAAVVLLVAAGAYLVIGYRSEQALLALAAEGQDKLAAVVTEPDRGRAHGQHGAPYVYPTPFPTSGNHDPIPTEPGFYKTPQSAGRLVHAAEHGHIVIYYDKPGAEAIAQLEDWAGLYGGNWDGVVAVPSSGLGDKVVLTAWRKRLDLEPYDATAAAAFIDAFRGRGPENPVR